ncbi:GNAT family N-acetyltransferase [Psychrobacillus sp. NEAU-3TGS]|uniref:GNAT family N-acetyltransferase n=1 Tax=Psychrobacillus sp. NEAU-3TGS TaxID=2995412 RepID=UPI002495CB0E|nr:GNAT family N-acetyltransferase [Psychrobacillus sp. NEAU-3TGS]MDI2588842.1 GNAT family N-acetyltransferase [Psychrobacillus sp. NEAU-3TGS]
MEEINMEVLPTSIRKLLTYVTSESKIDAEYKLYQEKENRKLYGYKQAEQFVGCIGVVFTEDNTCIIKQIGVFPDMRGRGIGERMINFIIENYSLSKIFAETDQDAVNFYKKMGFTIISLGEKYPRVERFMCKYKRTRSMKIQED